MCELDYLSWLELGGSCVRDHGLFFVVSCEFHSVDAGMWEKESVL